HVQPLAHGGPPEQKNGQNTPQPLRAALHCEKVSHSSQGQGEGVWKGGVVRLTAMARSTNPSCEDCTGSGPSGIVLPEIFRRGNFVGRVFNPSGGGRNE